jgi:hypothetical protein
MHSLRKLDEVALSLHQFEDDKSGERTGIERRQFSYSLYIPERRSGQQRRKELDLRKSQNGPSAY